MSMCNRTLKLTGAEILLFNFCLSSLVLRCPPSFPAMDLSISHDIPRPCPRFLRYCFHLAFHTFTPGFRAGV